MHDWYGRMDAQMWKTERMHRMNATCVARLSIALRSTMWTARWLAHIALHYERRNEHGWKKRNNGFWTRSVGVL